MESGFPTVDEARRRLIQEIERARREKVRILKIIHGWGSSGTGGKLGPALRKSLRLRIKEGKLDSMVTGEKFTSDSNEGRDLLRRYPHLRRDRDYNRANPGITLAEVSLEKQQGADEKTVPL